MKVLLIIKIIQQLDERGLLEMKQQKLACNFFRVLEKNFFSNFFLQIFVIFFCEGLD